MKEKLRFLGLDVHAETIAVAIAEPDGEGRSLGTIPNRAESIRKLIRKLSTRAAYVSPAFTRMRPFDFSLVRAPGSNFRIALTVVPSARAPADKLVDIPFRTRLMAARPRSFASSWIGVRRPRRAFGCSCRTSPPDGDLALVLGRASTDPGDPRKLWSVAST